MNSSSVRFLAALALGAAMVFSGCKSSPPPVAGTKNADGSVTNPDGSVTYPAGTKPAPTTVTKNADGSITNPDGSVTYPAGVKPSQAEPPTSATQPVAPPVAAPAPAPVASNEPAREASGEPAQKKSQQPAPAPSKTAPAGTSVAVTITETLAASKNNVGDSFSGVLAQPVTSKGAIVFPRGARVTGEVVAAKGRGKFKGEGALGIQVTSIDGIRVSTTEYEKTQAGKGKRTAGLVGGGAGLGAIIGGLAGGGKGALIGGLAGAGAGTAGAAYTGNKDVVIPSEATVTFKLTEPVTVK